MKIYIDLFFLFNIIMDTIIIVSVSILLKRRTNYFRIILSSLLGGIFSLLLFAKVNKIIIEIISIILISITAFGYKNIKYLIKNIIYMYLFSVLLGGVIYLFNIRVSTKPIVSYLIMIIISIEVMVLYVKEMKKIKNVYNNTYKVDIYFKDEEKISLNGFVDTGNNLYDPYQKRPIILVSNKYYHEDNFILVPYSTVNDHGLLKCIKIDKICIDGTTIKKEVLVSFSDSPILIDGVDVILHKDLVKGWLNVKIIKKII